MYKLIEIKKTNGVAKGILKTLDGVVVISIPIDPDNTDYQAYLKWLAEGNTPLPAEENT